MQQGPLPHYRRGFTLIELLVVIAIIGILSAVVLASLSSARAKSVDAQIKADLHTVTVQAALDYDGYPNSFGPAVAFSATPISRATLQTVPSPTGTPGTAGVSVFSTGSTGDLTGTAALIQAGIVGGGLYYGVSSSSYVVLIPLTASPNTYWCVDSTGVSRQEPNATAAEYSALTCP